jgi:hypothetical protein
VPFITQLIATALKLPQSRARRRAEPDYACAVYKASMNGCVGVRRRLGRVI